MVIHEAVHTALDPHHRVSNEWLAAQAADGDFISGYARIPDPGRRGREFLMWIAVRFRKDRIWARLATTVRSRIPNRLAFFDAQDFDVTPVR